MARSQLTDEQLQQAIDAYYENSGNKSEAARSLELSPSTYKDRLDVAQSRLGVSLGKVADGRLAPKGFAQRKLPRKGRRKFYLLTSIQNNTHLHPGWSSLLNVKDFYDNVEGSEGCELMVSTFSYNLSAYGPMATKQGRAKQQDDLWYAPQAMEYVVDDNVLLAPGLVFAGRSNILPTRKFPLSDKDQLHGRNSNIVPHSKQHLKSVPSMASEDTKFNVSTGTVTLSNYIQKDAGIMAEQEHSYGAVLVEVDDQGRWYIRHLEIDGENRIMDCGPDGYSGLVATPDTWEATPTEEVDEENSVALAINWGDTHASEMDLWVREMNFGEGGILDTLMPRYQFHNDLFSMRSRSHHEMKKPFSMYEKHADHEESVEDEVHITAEVLGESDRDWGETVVVPSNHDRHLDRWAEEEDWKDDPVNARFLIKCIDAKLTAIDEGDRDFNLLEWALRRAGNFGMVRFLAEDESFVIGKGAFSQGFPGIECGLHGDLGPNGAGGSTHSLLRLGRPINKGHDHQATRWGLVMSAGACAESFIYMRGPNSHSVAHILTYKNGARTHLITYGRKWRA